ncbi:MAG TPA: DNA polymerase III subunit delta [Candidatus Aquicultor sp.]|jgi:DNA polymerase-3 subunit delta
MKSNPGAKAQPRQKVKPLKPVYLIFGDKKMIAEGLARLKNRIGAQFDLEFNFNRFSGGDTNAAYIIEAANTLPFMSDKRLIVVKDVEKLSADDITRLVKYIENPSDTTCLVLVANTINRASRLYKAVEKAGEIAEYKLKESPLTWIKKEFGARGQLVSDAVARHILQVVGSDLLRLSIEIEKISLYCNDDRIIDPGDVDPIITKSTELSVFDLVDRIGERNIRRALEILDSLLQQKEAPLAILALIARHFRLLLRTKVWVETGHDNRYLVEHLTGDAGKKLPSFVVAKYREQSYNFSADELKGMFERMLQADIALKSSAQSAESTMQDLIIQLA